MKNKPVIIWEKWVDPFGFDDQQEDDLDSEYTDSYDDEEELLQESLKPKKIKCQIINTPFGLVPINENTASTKIFNFWSGHTNFSITVAIANIIENTDGVETLNVFTRYRFRIGIGKAFKDSFVMRAINNNVYNYLNINVSK
jgi:hypothetical protein